MRTGWLGGVTAGGLDRMETEEVEELVGVEDCIGVSGVEPAAVGTFMCLGGVASGGYEVVGDRDVGNFGQAGGDVVGLVVAAAAHL